MKVIFNIIAYCCLISFTTQTIYSQSVHTLKRNGDLAYTEADYGQAEIDYHKAYEKEKDHKSSFNLGNALFQQERFEEAATYFENAAGMMPDNVSKSMALHNLGNALLNQQKLEESIEAYKKAIRLNPNDSDIKENLLLAKMAKKQQEEQQQQEQGEEGEQGEENQEQQEQGEEGEQNQEQKEGENQEQQDSTQQQQQEQQDSLQQQQAQESELDSSQIDSSQLIPAIKLSKEEAARLLQAAEQEERKVQEKLKRVKSNKKKPSKDW